MAMVFEVTRNPFVGALRPLGSRPPASLTRARHALHHHDEDSGRVGYSGISNWISKALFCAVNRRPTVSSKLLKAWR